MNNTQKFQHDGAPSYKTKFVSSWLQENETEVMGPCPGTSPNLNPIENCWDHIKIQVQKLKPSSVEELREKINKAGVDSTYYS